MPHSRLLTVITNFLGALSQKENDFSWIINQVLKIFWFQALRKPRFKNKGNFWIKCVCIKAFVSWYTHRRAFTSSYTHKDTSVSWHASRGHTHHGMHQGYICITACQQGYICITAYLQGYICITTYLQKGYLHHDIPIRRHLHHKTLASPSL